MRDDRNFDEYYWENYFRERDKENRQYISELPKYIYLPGETIILKKNFQIENSQLNNYTEFEDFENFDEVFGDEQEQQHPMMKKILELARTWLLIQNSALENSEKKIGLRVNALLAIAVEKLSIILQATDDNPSLTIAYCKRLRSELSKCEELMRKIAKHSNYLETIIIEKTTILAEISEFISDTIFNLRKKKTTQS